MSIFLVAQLSLCLVLLVVIYDLALERIILQQKHIPVTDYGHERNAFNEETIHGILKYSSIDELEDILSGKTVIMKIDYEATEVLKYYARKKIKI